MCKPICSLYETTLRLPHIKQFLSTLTPNYRLSRWLRRAFTAGSAHLASGGEPTRRLEPAIPHALDSVSALFWSERVECRCRKTSALVRKQVSMIKMMRRLCW